MRTVPPQIIAVYPLCGVVATTCASRTLPSSASRPFQIHVLSAFLQPEVWDAPECTKTPPLRPAPSSSSPALEFQYPYRLYFALACIVTRLGLINRTRRSVRPRHSRSQAVSTRVSRAFTRSGWVGCVCPRPPTPPLRGPRGSVWVLLARRGWQQRL